MSYTPHTWQSGETVTAEKLNVLEQGVAGAGGGVFVIRVVLDGQTVHLDKTWQEIRDALAAGQLCVIPYGFNEVTQDQDGMDFVYMAERDVNNYYIRIYRIESGSNPVSLLYFMTDEGPNGYPGIPV